jgi:hypothetical protein
MDALEPADVLRQTMSSSGASASILNDDDNVEPNFNSNLRSSQRNYSLPVAYAVNSDGNESD